LPAFTGAAIRFRLYATAGITAIDVATISAFCSPVARIGLATVAGLSLFFAPRTPPRCCTCRSPLVVWWARCCSPAVGAYALWASLARGRLEIRAWALRPRGGDRPHADGLSVMDLSLVLRGAVVAAAPQTHIGFLTFLGVYAAAVIAGIVSHVPAGWAFSRR